MLTPNVNPRHFAFVFKIISTHIIECLLGVGALGNLENKPLDKELTGYTRFDMSDN